MEEFINIFQDLIHQFQPKQKLLNLVQNIPDNLITIHLRRTDKSSIYISGADSHGVDLKDIEDLNNKTKNLINKFIENEYHSFYFSSDCPNTKKDYENMYQNQNIINYHTNKDIEQTYIDIYLMSKSKYIILSQKHSSFSLFSSMINKSKFIYFYTDSIVHYNNYTYLNHIFLIDNLIIKMNNTGILYFHQGWTDIINCLSLINYYCNIYDKIYLIIRDDAIKMIDFYIKDINNIKILYEEKKNIDCNGINFVINKYKDLNLQNSDFLCIGCHDYFRKDNYSNKFLNSYDFFVKKFYECYNISYITRINDFSFTRNLELENNVYDNFINKYGNKYILYHEVIENYDTDKQIVNLNGISEIFFDMIKVLENAIEIHLLDSIWGAFIYLLDGKYKLFQNKKIFLYANRGYNKMFTEPIKLDNWTII